jgi:hypothetical protein
LVLAISFAFVLAACVIEPQREQHEVRGSAAQPAREPHDSSIELAAPARSAAGPAVASPPAPTIGRESEPRRRMMFLGRRVATLAHRDEQ